MPDMTIHRGLMGAATATPTDPAARLRALQQRIQTRKQSQPPMPRAPQRPTGGGLPPRQPNPSGGYDGSGINPGGNAAPPMSTIPRQVSSPVLLPDAGMPSTPAAPPGMPPAVASMQAAPRRPAGAPAAPSGINPTVPGVAMRDAAMSPADAFARGFAARG